MKYKRKVQRQEVKFNIYLNKIQRGEGGAEPMFEMIDNMK